MSLMNEVLKNLQERGEEKTQLFPVLDLKQVAVYGDLLELNESGYKKINKLVVAAVFMVFMGLIFQSVSVFQRAIFLKPLLLDPVLFFKDIPDRQAWLSIGDLKSSQPIYFPNYFIIKEPKNSSDNKSEIKPEKKQYFSEQKSVSQLAVKAFSFLELKKYSESISIYEQLIEMQPWNDAWRFGYAKNLESLGRLKEAREVYSSISLSKNLSETTKNYIQKKLRDN
jgi:tetratricopeptide (TPR) repeat protein